MPNDYWIGSTGSQPWSTAANWSDTAVPVNGDDITVANATSSIDSGLAQSAVTLASLSVPQTFEGAIGATAFRVGDPSNNTTVANGSGRIKLDTGAVQTTGVVVGTKSAGSDTGLEPFRWKGTHASNKLYVLGGRVGIATTTPAEVATLTELSLDGSGAVVNVGAGVTLGTLRLKAGTCNLKAGATTVKQDGGTLNTSGSGAITTLTMTAGTANLASTGTITTLEVLSGGVADFTGSSQARTVTTVKLHKGATLKYDPEVVTVTNPIQVLDGTPGDVTILTPPVVNITIAAA
jgi:hypothetical protein